MMDPGPHYEMRNGAPWPKAPDDDNPGPHVSSLLEAVAQLATETKRTPEELTPLEIGGLLAGMLDHQWYERERAGAIKLHQFREAGKGRIVLP